MGGEWPNVELGDLIEILTGYPFKSNQYSENGHGIKLLRGDNVVQGSFRWEGVKLWPEEALIDKHESYWLKVGDVILAMDRPWIEAGLKTSQITSHDLPALLVQRVSCLRSKDGLDQNFLRYLISSYWFTEYVKSIQTGTAVPHISAGQIKAYTFNLPPIHEQRTIGIILKSLDDKIELNRQINTTLESMAQALFKSWFVDFDPVIDNALAAGNPIPDELQARAEKRQALLAQTTSQPDAPLQPLPADIRALFPASFVLNEEMGWVPEGWAISDFAKVADVIMGQSPDGDTYNTLGEGVPLVNGPVEFGYYFADKSKWTTAPTKMSSKGDLIVCVRGSTTGRYVKSNDELCLGRGVCAIRGKNSQAFADLVFKDNIERLLQLTTGSTFPNWSGPTLKSFSTICPTPEMLVHFDTQVSPWIELLESNVKQMSILSSLRDQLLPKLLSGQIQLPDAEQQLAEAL